jgi:hypothetical protein
MRSMWLLMLVMFIGAPVGAQERDDVAAPVKKLVISDAAMAPAFADARRDMMQQRRDSVKNGAIIGAVIGGAGMGIFTTYLCNALQEPGDPSCWRGVLTISALFAGIGAAAGAGIDALIARQTPLPTRPDRGGSEGSRGVIRVRF